MDNADNKKLKPQPPFWLITLLILIISIYFFNIDRNNPNSEDSVIPCSFILFVFFYLGLIINLTLRITAYLRLPEWQERMKRAIFNNMPGKERMSHLIDGIKPFYISIIKELTLFSVIFIVSLYILLREPILESGLPVIFLSIYIGQFIFLSAVTMISLWEIYFAVQNKLHNRSSLRTVLFHVFFQFPWTCLIVSILTSLIESYNLSFGSWSTNIETAIEIQLSAFYFLVVFYIYYIRLKKCLKKPDDNVYNVKPGNTIIHQSKKQNKIKNILELAGPIVLILVFILIHMLEAGSTDSDGNTNCCLFITPILYSLTLYLYFAFKIKRAIDSCLWYNNVKNLLYGRSKVHSLGKLIKKILPAYFSVIKSLSLFTVFLLITLYSITKGKILHPFNLTALVSFYSAEFITVTAMTMIAVKESVSCILENRPVRVYQKFAQHFFGWLVASLFLLFLSHTTVETGKFAYILQMDRSLLIAFAIQISAVYFHLVFYHFGKTLEDEFYR